MNSFRKILLLNFGLFLAVSFSFGMTDQEIKELLVRTDNNATPKQYEGMMVMKNYKPDQDMVQNRTHLYFKNDKVIAVFVSPPIQKGQAFVRDGDNMWMFLPKSKKVTRIGAKDKSMGGEASNADIMRTKLAEDYDGVYLGDETVGGVACYKIELKARERTVAYDKVVYWISKDKELPVKREYYTLSGKKSRTMTFGDIKMLGGRERPALMVISNEENKDYKTEIIIESLSPDAKIEDYIFTPAYVKQGILE